ncbi:MAG: ROK family protein [Candidatus Omnitrophica bacterium]|nr:ROK family protein [Candidatus Omnitrophota bacterium]MBD3269255.1 ROK family protein [Candidatus Omnitrophota bacterium]
MKVFLGIDWGGTYIKAGVVDNQGIVLEKRFFSSPDFRKKNIFLTRIGFLLKDFKNFKIQAVGIGAPGIVNTRKGSIYYLPNIKGWKNFPLKQKLAKYLDVPVFIDNDANVFALAEARRGAARGKSRAIFLTLGTGLGSSIVFDKKILKAETSAWELGHVPVVLKGRKCGCGGRGCIETFVGNRYLLKRYKSIRKGYSEAGDVEDIYKKALKGEKAALRVWEEFSHALGIFLSGMINIFNPQAIIFGGGISGAFKVFKPMVLKEIKQQAMWPHLKGLKLLKAKAKDAGISGAGLLAKESMNN